MSGKVLVVENSDALRKLYADEFANDGYAVTEAADAFAAFESATQAKPDVIVLGACTSVAGGSSVQGLEALGRSLKRLGCRLVVNTGNLSVFGDDRFARIADAMVLKSSDLGALKQTLRGLIPDAVAV